MAEEETDGAAGVDPGGQASDDPAGRPSPLDELGMLLWIAIGIGLLALIAASSVGILAVIGVGALIFLAAFATGAFLGFLFGVPRVLSQDNQSSTNNGAAAASPRLTGTVGQTAGAAGTTPSATTAKRL